MLSKFWESVGSALAGRWAAIGVPALIFWAGGLLAWTLVTPDVVPDLAAGLERRTAIVQLAYLFGVLLLIAASALVVDRLTAPVLRLLEGYWPRWARGPRRLLASRARRRADRDDSEWQRLRACLALASQPAGPDGALENSSAGEGSAGEGTGTAGSLLDEDLAELAGLERRLHYRPAAPSRMLPTRVGNILRSAEDRQAGRYGLDAVVVWPRLWLLLPDPARQELNAARASLDAAVAVAIWGMLFTGFAPLTLWAVPIGLVVAVGAVRWWVPVRAEVFADLLDAAYDLHRGELYRQLRWPLPADPADERRIGVDLTAYLWRGSDSDRPRFTTP